VTIKQHSRALPLERQARHRHLSLQQRLSGIIDMLKWALFFFFISIIAAIFGFTGIAAAAAGIAKILFFIFIVICVIFLILGLMVGRAVF
jgi:uncharacterized membrane protein YtjA (UPF0391 family)